jgi:outer membrane protein
MRLTTLILIFIGGIANAQSPVLDQYIHQGLESNLALRQQQMEIEKSIKAIEIAKTHFFPQVNFAPTYSVAFGGRKIDIPIGDLLNPVYSTLNALTGTSVFPQVENTSEQMAPMNFHDTKLEIKVPLFNSDIKYNVQLQKQLLLTEEAKKKYLQLELKANIESAYYQYLQALEAIRIFAYAENLAKENVLLNQKLLQHEEVLIDAQLTAEYELSKVQIQKKEAEKNAKVAKAYFNFLLNRNLEENIEADSAFFSQPPLLKPISYFQENALLNRPEFEQLQTGLAAQQTLVSMNEKNALLPTLFLGVNTGFQGFGYTFRNQAYMVGQVGMTWNLYNAGQKKLKIQQSRIGALQWNSKLEEAKKQIEMQIYKAYHDAVQSQEALQSKTLDLNRTKKVHDLVQSRYKNGAALTIEITKAQNDLTAAQLSYTIEKLSTWIKYSELKKASGYQ